MSTKCLPIDKINFKISVFSKMKSQKTEILRSGFLKKKKLCLVLVFKNSNRNTYYISNNINVLINFENLIRKIFFGKIANITLTYFY